MPRDSVYVRCPQCGENSFRTIVDLGDKSVELDCCKSCGTDESTLTPAAIATLEVEAFTSHEPDHEQDEDR